MTVARKATHRRERTAVTAISKISARPVTKEACLVVIYGPELGRRYAIEKPSVTIGRSVRADIQIDQDSISRVHAKLVQTTGHVVIRDMGSTNGTYVNDEAVTEYVLRDGDLIKIGRAIFKFLTGGNIENEYHEEVYRLTTVDGLTQIFNKRYFQETLERELSRANRYGRVLSLVLVDIDFFKRVNDQFGHLCGDAVLKQLAQLVRSRIRREDILARYGGEEFALLLPETDATNAMAMAQKLRKLVERHHFRYEDVDVPLTVSMGVATTVVADGMTPKDLFKLADQRLYAAKSSGRNTVAA